MRFMILGFITTLIIGLAAQPGYAAKVVRPDVIVHLTREQPTHQLIETSRLELTYGDTPGAIGFEPAGNERQANGPSAFDVDPQGAYIVADSVHRV
ncbi:MAG: hypothetical protein JRJ19_15735, partial [Deltaproteobacteria bacterium]|nr:hypothetical protein [Deltaproteobacteria bacterium]